MNTRDHDISTLDKLINEVDYHVMVLGEATSVGSGTGEEESTTSKYLITKIDEPSVIYGEIEGIHYIVLSLLPEHENLKDEVLKRVTEEGLPAPKSNPTKVRLVTDAGSGHTTSGSLFVAAKSNPTPSIAAPSDAEINPS